FFHGGSTAGAEVKRITFLIGKGEDVRRGEVKYMDVIPDAGSVRSLEVSPKNFCVRQLAKGDLQDAWNQVRFGPMRFAELCRGPSHVEVAQCHAGKTVNLIKPPEDLLEHQLRLAVGVDRVLRHVFVDR